MIGRDWRGRDGLLALDRISRATALALLGATGLLIALGLFLTLATPHGPKPPGGADGRLYDAVIHDVARGERYATAAAREHRLAGAPLRPFIAVRPPLLAEGLARLPSPEARSRALAAFAFVVWAAWAWRLRPLRREPVRYAFALALSASGISLALSGGVYFFHEEWAGLLIALSLAVRTPGFWLPSVALGLTAAVLRELAFPYLAAMTVLAMVEGRRREAAAWGLAIAAAGAALALHAHAVAAVTNAHDLASPGWARFAGWCFILQLAQLNAFLLPAPLWVTALMLPPALLGLAFWAPDDDGLGRRTGLTILGYVLAFCVVGRPDNDYWGLLLAPLWPLGLLQADRVAVHLLALACLSHRRSMVAT